MQANSIISEDSSFRDNRGNIYYYNNKVLRSINHNCKKTFESILDSKIIDDSIKKNFLINTTLVDKSELPEFFSKFEYVVESDLIPFITYPYEWSYEQLKTAALHHLNFQISLFQKGFVLRDASAYNIQFIGSKPFFIDLLSIKEYEKGEYWIGYKQFCENFLNPLLLGSLKGIYHNNWFKGELEGISTTDLNKLLSIKDKLSFKIFTHVYLQAKLQSNIVNNKKKNSLNKIKLKPLSKKSYLAIITQLRDWINNLSFKQEKTIWENYSRDNTYNDLQHNQKKKIVEEFIQRTKPNTLIDLGCNDGEYSNLALNSGAFNVIGFDFDHKAISNAFKMSSKEKKNFLPLFLDASNPSPNHGWQQLERKGFVERFKAEALIALAFEHHLVIGKNIPIKKFILWMLNISNQGLIEFVPKSDKTVQIMLESREDIFLNYTENEFEKSLKEKARIINKNNISNSKRIIFEYKVN